MKRAVLLVFLCLWPKWGLADCNVLELSPLHYGKPLTSRFYVGALATTKTGRLFLGIAPYVGSGLEGIRERIKTQYGEVDSTIWDGELRVHYGSSSRKGIISEMKSALGSPANAATMAFATIKSRRSQIVSNDAVLSEPSFATPHLDPRLNPKEPVIVDENLKHRVGNLVQYMSFRLYDLIQDIAAQKRPERINKGEANLLLDLHGFLTVFKEQISGDPRFQILQSYIERTLEASRWQKHGIQAAQESLIHIESMRQKLYSPEAIQDVTLIEL